MLVRVLSMYAMVLSVIVTALSTGGVAAQGATPAPTAALDVLFVQTFATGRLEPADEAGVATLTLAKPVGDTIYFADRPNRVAGTVPLDEFLHVLSREAADPLNAALVIDQPGPSSVIVLELLSGTVDEAGVVSYQVRILPDPGALNVDVTRTASVLTEIAEPLAFGLSHLFVDEACLTCFGAGV